MAHTEDAKPDGRCLGSNDERRGFELVSVPLPGQDPQVLVPLHGPLLDL